MKRGFIFLEALVSCFLLLSLGIALFPLAGRMVEETARVDRRGHCVTQAFFAVDFVTEKVRNALPYDRESAGGGSFYRYRDYSQYGPRTYTFFVEGEKLKLDVYGTQTQPVTGEYEGSHEKIAFKRMEERPFFDVDETGLVRLSFSMEGDIEGVTYGVRTAILPYRDWYAVGGAYE